MTEGGPPPTLRAPPLPLEATATAPPEGGGGGIPAGAQVMATRVGRGGMRGGGATRGRLRWGGGMGLGGVTATAAPQEVIVVETLYQTPSTSNLHPHP